MPAVSVIMPVYNSENYLRSAIDSVLNQTFQDFELILIDDGSKDSSGAICDEYAQADTRVVVIHQENTGLCGARNRGIDIAKGDYLAFADNDDEFSADLLEVNYRIAKLKDADMLKFGRVMIYMQDGVYCGETIRQFPEEELNGADLSGNYVRYRNMDVLSAVWDGLYRTKIVRDTGLQFDTNLRYGGEDWVFCIDMYRHSQHVVLNPGVYYTHYFRKNHSVSAVNDAKSVQGYLTVANGDMETYKYFGEPDPEGMVINIVNHYISPLLLSLNQVKSMSKSEKIRFIDQVSQQKGYQFTMNDELYRKVKDISLRKAMVARLFLKREFSKLLLFAKFYQRVIQWKQRKRVTC